MAPKLLAAARHELDYIDQVRTQIELAEDLEDLREVNLIPFSYRANRSADSRWLTFIPVRWRPAEPAP